jgi:hypothetical protein
MTRDTQSLIGASVLSTAGSLPQHLRPLIVAVLIADGQTTVGGAGVVASIVLFGLPTIALVLPLFNVQKIDRYGVILAAILLIFGLVLSVLSLLAGWFIIGVSCGVFQYVGILTAALHSKPSTAVPIRLGITLGIAGSAAALLSLMPVAAYHSMLLILSATFAALLIIGIGLHQPIKPPPRKLGHDSGWMKYAVLTLVFLLFVGQTGLLAFVIQQATERGFPLGQAFWALALMKVIAGLILLLIRGAEVDAWLLSLTLATANVVVATTTDFPVFAVALLLLEISFYLLSAKLQARAANLAPIFTGQWLLAVSLLGAAAGPLVHGHAITTGWSFFYLAVLSALAPLVLLLRRQFQTS